MDQLFEALDKLLDVKLENVTEGTVDDLGQRLDACLRAHVALKDLIDGLELQLIDTMPEDDITVEGVGILHRVKKYGVRVRSKTATRKMREDIAVAVAKKVGLDPFTGEVNNERRLAALDAARAIWEVVPSFTKMKTNGASTYGLNQEDYTEETETTRLELELPLEDDNG